MNYIEFINRFWSIDLEANFSHLEVHLYFKLLEINNRLGWKESFRFPNSRLEAEIGSRPKNLINARQRLVDLGVISYKKGTTRDAGVYTLLSEFHSYVVTKESNKESNSESNHGTNEKVITEAIRGSLTKQEETKQEETPKAPVQKTEAIDYQKFVGLYHELCPDLPSVTALSDSRKRAIKARVKEHGKQKVSDMLEIAGKSKFLAGNNERKWKANIDWLFNPSNFVKVLDGCYETRVKNDLQPGQKFKSENKRECDW